MATPKLFHNPNCSKSRAAKDLVTEQGADVEIVQYLKSPPSREELTTIVAGLDGEPAELVRTKDAKFTALGLDPADYTTPAAVVELLVEHPEVMERPVLLVDDRAAIGRPLERIESLLPE
jgi:arsenate reductase